MVTIEDGNSPRHLHLLLFQDTKTYEPGVLICSWLWFSSEFKQVYRSAVRSVRFSLILSA